MTIRTTIAALAFAALLAVASWPVAATVTSWYASPTGAGTACTIDVPCPLAFAIGATSPALPGDTVWLRGGTYNGIFESRLVGTPTAPIIVRNYSGERATLDGGTNTSILLMVSGSYTWFWGFEITSSSTDRLSTQVGSSPTDLDRPYEAISNAQTPGAGVGIKIINMVIHNLGQGVALWVDATNAEAYGNLIYYNGWNAPDRAHGHGIYSQNAAPSTRTIRDNIFYANYDYNVQMSGSNAHLDNHVIDGNIVFWDGAANTVYGGAALVMGGALSSTGNALTTNAFYGSPHGGTLNFSLGNQNVTMTGNLVGAALNTEPRLEASVLLDNQTGTVNISGNEFYAGQITPPNYASLYPSNNYWLWPSAPTGTWTLVRPNVYEGGRGHVAVFNWDHAASISVDLSSVLAVGSTYEIRNAQDYFGTPMVTGTYTGGTVSIPMSGSSVETPAGAAAPSPTGPEFNAFVVQTVAGVQPTVMPTQTPTSAPPTATPTPTWTPAPPTATVPPTPTPTRVPPGHAKKTPTH